MAESIKTESEFATTAGPQTFAAGKDADASVSANVAFDPTRIERPDPALCRYYAIVCLLGGPLFPFLFLPLYFKYRTLHYRLDDSGISMKWGILFRREIHLTYRRIQDIHLNRNLAQRWMGLSSLGIQTASGKSTPEMTIEGILETDQLRDYLYAQMRGARGEEDAATDSESTASDKAHALLCEIRDALRQLADRSTGQEPPA